VRGVKGIAEEIEVRLMGPHKKTDPEIAEAVTNALSWHVWTPESVKAKVEKGRVTLTGQVDYEFQRNAAMNSVRFLAGVNGVTNNIMVTARVDIPNIRKKIEEALVRDAELEAEHVQVIAGDDGTITLSGDVHSFFEKQAAESAAWRAEGVCVVNNNLRVI
jgi:osmotically-inducible protein OsmY